MDSDHMYMTLFGTPGEANSVTDYGGLATITNTIQALAHDVIFTTEVNDASESLA